MRILYKFGYLSAFLLPLIAVLSWYGGWAYNYLTAAFVFLFITLIDYFVGLDTRNIPKEKTDEVSHEMYYRFITYSWVFVQIAFVVWGCFVIGATPHLPLYSRIGFVLGFSLITGGIGITVAHELGHKKSALERLYSKLLLMTVCYMHFYIEHNRGHHVTVATPEDPATARKHENFYSFWIRSVFHGYAHAWKLERDRLNRQGKSVWNFDNAMFAYTLLPILFGVSLMLGISWWFDRTCWDVLIFFFAQSIGAFTLLELVNYIEHYGIVRRKLSNGQYERVNPLHSWNASHLVSNFFLFQLQRHSDHHANAIKRYQVLDHFDESPQLPFGYPTMILIALLPPLWFRIMNPKLEEWERKNYSPALAA